MIEAELKFYVQKRDRLLSALAGYASPRHLLYADQYFNHPSLDFTSRDSEFRVRAVSENGTATRTILTYKADIADTQTQSKSEYEALIASSQSELRRLLEAMGFVCYIEFEKICEHFEFKRDGRKIAATVVSLKEVPDTFVEIESLVASSATVQPELEWLRGFATSLGLADADRTTVTYEGMVAQARRKDPKR